VSTLALFGFEPSLVWIAGLVFGVAADPRFAGAVWADALGEAAVAGLPDEGAFVCEAELPVVPRVCTCAEAPVGVAGFAELFSANNPSEATANAAVRNTTALVMASLQALVTSNLSGWSTLSYPVIAVTGAEGSGNTLRCAAGASWMV
jgi:hypothetical protein